MNRLSYEVIDLIAALLPLKDAVALSQTCTTVRAGCHSRLSPDSYLAKTFRTPRYLLAAMTDYGCVLSGSRALEYFVPGSSSDESDWDFLVPCIESSVLGMMDALETCGVRWESALSGLLALPDKARSAGSVARLFQHLPPGASDDELVVHVNRTTICDTALDDVRKFERPSPWPEQLQLYDALRQYATCTDGRRNRPAWIEVMVSFRLDPEARKEDASTSATSCKEACDRLQPGKLYELCQGRLVHRKESAGSISAYTRVSDIVYRFSLFDRGQQSDGAAGYSCASPEETSAYRLINGYTAPAVSPKRQKVQLFMSHSTENHACTPLQYILDTYYASHVQCFISGWAAGHFFYDLASLGFAISWKSIHSNDDEAMDNTYAKYRARGYQFIRVLCHADYVRGKTRNGGTIMGISTIPSGPGPESGDEPWGAVNTAVHHYVDDGRRGTNSAQGKTQRITDPGVYVYRFTQLQQKLWSAAMCPACGSHFQQARAGLGTHRCSCGTKDRASTAQTQGPKGEGQWKGPTHDQYRLMCQSLADFTWQIGVRYDGLWGRIRPHSAKAGCSTTGLDHQEYPSTIRGFMSGRDAPLIFEKPVPQSITEHTNRPEPAAGSWNLRDVLAVGVAEGVVPSSEEDNMAGVAPRAVVQGLVPCHEAGEALSLSGRLVAHVDPATGQPGAAAAGFMAAGAERVPVDSRWRTWLRMRYLVSLAPMACNSRLCDHSLTSSMPPQI